MSFPGDAGSFPGGSEVFPANTFISPDGAELHPSDALLFPGDVESFPHDSSALIVHCNFLVIRGNKRHGYLYFLAKEISRSCNATIWNRRVS